MPIPRLHADSTALVVIDIQDRIIHTIHQHEAIVTRCAALIHAANVLKVPVFVTEQNPRGLGHTVAKILEILPPDSLVSEKQSFSAFTPQVKERLRQSGRRDLLVCGIEAHVCVLQTILDACAQGTQTFHVTDAISSGQPNQIESAFRRMETAGSIPTGVVSSLYEMMGTCDHPSFRSILPFAKAAVASAPL